VQSPPFLQKHVTKVLMRVAKVVIPVKVQSVRWGITMGVPLWPSLRIPNSNPSQARFNPDESSLRLMWIDSSKVSPPRIGIGPSWFQLLCWGFCDRAFTWFFFLGKTSPTPSNARWLKLLESFKYGAGASATVHLLGSFSSKKRHPHLRMRGGRSSWRVLSMVLGLQRLCVYLVLFP
jgi:hypothetical protein